MCWLADTMNKGSASCSQPIIWWLIQTSAITRMIEVCRQPLPSTEEVLNWVRNKPQRNVCDCHFVWFCSWISRRIPSVTSTAISCWTHMDDHSYAMTTVDVRGICGIIKWNVLERKYRSVAGMKCAVVWNVKWSQKFKAAVLKMSPRFTDCVPTETEKWRSFPNQQDLSRKLIGKTYRSDCFSNIWHTGGPPYLGGNTFQDLLRLRKTADNPERYI
jgi:hypothetical protein